MVLTELSPDERLLALARATVRPMPQRFRSLSMGELAKEARAWADADPPERVTGLIREAVGLVRAGTNPLRQWPALWNAARTDWLKVVLATVIDLEEEGVSLRNDHGETVLHWLSQEASLFGGFGQLTWPHAWLSLPDSRGDLPLHAVWHPIHGIQGRIEAILKGPEKEHWNAYERLDEAIETTEVLLAGGADWEQVNSNEETASDRLLAAYDAGVFRWLNNNANVAWIEPVLEAQAKQRRLKALDVGLPAPVAMLKARF